MVAKLTLLTAFACLLFGCSSPEEASTQRSRPQTADEQIAAIEKRTDMPDDIKAQTIASLRQQQAAQQAAAGARK